MHLLVAGMDGYVSKPIRVETNRQFCCLVAQ
jgi:hypothetical protein